MNGKSPFSSMLVLINTPRSIFIVSQSNLYGVLCRLLWEPKSSGRSPRIPYANHPRAKFLCWLEAHQPEARSPLPFVFHAEGIRSMRPGGFPVASACQSRDRSRSSSSARAASSREAAARPASRRRRPCAFFSFPAAAQSNGSPSYISDRRAAPER